MRSDRYFLFLCPRPCRRVLVREPVGNLGLDTHCLERPGLRLCSAASEQTAIHVLQDERVHSQCAKAQIWCTQISKTKKRIALWAGTKPLCTWLKFISVFTLIRQCSTKPLCTCVFALIRQSSLSSDNLRSFSVHAKQLS